MVGASRLRPVRRFAIILGGGRSARMGRDKRSLTLDGRSLLALAVDACADRERVVVVTPDLPGDVSPERVIRTLEDPPFGGPVAGIAAGVAALPPARPHDEVLLLACDLPRVAAIVATLDDAPLVEPAGTQTADPAVSTNPTDRRTGTTDRDDVATHRETGTTHRGSGATDRSPDGVCLLDAEDYPQYLAARYRRDALAARLAAVGDPRSQSVRRLMSGLELLRIPAPGITADVDTPDDASAAGIDG